MKKINAIAQYLCAHYPHARDISKARLTKMVYLADWRATLVNGEPLTDIKWFYNYYGPYVDDVVNAVKSDSAFEIIDNPEGRIKERIVLKKKDRTDAVLSDAEKSILDHVIEATQNFTWSEFLRFIYSTLPIIITKKFTYIDLKSAAARHRELFSK